MIRVDDVRPRSIAEELGIPPGTRLLRLNGHELRDAVDLQFYQAEASVELEAELPDGRPVVYDIEKGPDDSLGIVPEPDKIRRCTNACPFCFIHGNPKQDKLRRSLYVKDDDYRLSFMYGHYVTLTNLREGDWERIFEQRLSPLFVSVHATDPDVRLSILKNPRSAAINDHLDRLQEGGIRFHTQVVLCPGVNDGAVLRRTMDDLYARGPEVLSLSVVPVGLTAHNAGGNLRQLNTDECRRALGLVERTRRRARTDGRSTAWCYASDDLFLQAELEPPGPEYFDDGALTANGVGAISELRTRVRGSLDRLPELEGQRIGLVTGTAMGPTLEELSGEIAEATGARVRAVTVENSLYGPQVTSAALLPGRDVRRALEGMGDVDRALIAEDALNDSGLFLDDVSLEELREDFPELEICPSRHVTDALTPA